MEQILNKLSEIEITAQRIMEDADRTKAALSAEMEQQCKAFDSSLDQELRRQLEQQKDKELTALRNNTEAALRKLESYYNQNHQQLSEELFHKLLEC